MKKIKDWTIGGWHVFPIEPKEYIAILGFVLLFLANHYELQILEISGYIFFLAAIVLMYKDPEADVDEKWVAIGLGVVAVCLLIYSILKLLGLV